jgi:hypothetical protein
MWGKWGKVQQSNWSTAPWQLGMDGHLGLEGQSVTVTVAIESGHYIRRRL